MSTHHSGRILVVPAEALDRLGRFQGFSDRADHYLDGLLRPDWLRFLPRAAMESDPTHKQLIPYVVFRSGDRVFHYTRGKSHGETRLHSLKSIGVGGHVDEPDAEGRTTAEAYETALRRELDEEVRIDSPGTLRRVGLINDDSTPVGSVHLGVVYLYELERPAVVAREDGLTDAGFVPIADAVRDRLEYETWSQICIDSVLSR